jgi:hypothetical protein
VRATVAAVVGLLAVIAVATANVALWVHATLLDTARFTAAVAPLSGDPAVQRVVTDEATAAVQSALRSATADLPAFLRDLVAEALAATDDPLRAAVTRTVASPEFAAAWEDAVRQSHASTVAAIREPARLDAATADRIVLDLDPLAARFLEPVAAALPEQVAALLRPDLPDVVVVTSDVLASETSAGGRAALAWLDRYAVPLAVAAGLLTLLALVLARRRWRALAWLAAGVAVLAALTWLLVALLPWLVTPRTATDDQAAALAAVVTAVSAPLQERSGWLAAGAAGVAVVAAIVAAATGRRAWQDRDVPARSEVSQP